MCEGQKKRSYGFLMVKFYAFTNLFIFIFSILHYVVALNPYSFISDNKKYLINFQGDLAIVFVGTANRYLIVFIFNVMNSIILWIQFIDGGIKERIIMEVVCSCLSYLELVFESIALLVKLGNYVTSVIPLFILTVIIFLQSIYFMIIIIFTAEKVEKKFIRNMEINNNKNNKNIKIDVNQPRIIELELKNNLESQPYHGQEVNNLDLKESKFQ